MIVTKTFVWAHLPKAAGNTVGTILAMFPEMIEFADPLPSVKKHTWFKDRPDLVAGRQRVLCIRRLPSWQLSYSMYKSRAGLHPDYRPLPMDSLAEMRNSKAADMHLSPFVEGGATWPDRWIRVEQLVDDVLALLDEHTEVTPEKREQILALAPQNAGSDYDRSPSAWFTEQMMGRLYERNPLWQRAEELAYAAAGGNEDRHGMPSAGGTRPRPSRAEISAVDVDDSSEGVVLELSSPRPGSPDALSFVFLLEGRLKAPTHARQIEIRAGGRMLRAVPVLPMRSPDGDSTGDLDGDDNRLFTFSALIGTLRLPATFTLELHLRLESGERLKVGEVAGARPAISLPAGVTPRLSPLMLTSLGRTGTTWLMRLLGEHPEIVTKKRYPFEAKPHRYWMHWLQLMSEPANHVQSAHPDTFHAQQWAIGADPFFTADLAEDYPKLAELLAGERVLDLAEFAHRSTETYYTHWMKQLDRPSAAWFAEKHTPDAIPALIWELYPHAKEAFLVRDPRDMLASIDAFNAKRGFVAFGRDLAESDAAYVRQIAQTMTGLLEAWRTRSHKSHLVRYEDLILEPRRTLAALFEYVGVDSSEIAVDRILESGHRLDSSLNDHMTSNDPAASIGRWERDLSADIQELCCQEFGPVLAGFGYSG